LPKKKTFMLRPLPLACLAAVVALGVVPANASEDVSDQGGNVQVDVVVDMTDAGRNVAPPTPDKPVYYLPLPEGFDKVGFAAHFQRPPPTALEVEQFIEKVFAKQGYRVLVHGSHPTLALDLVWGYISPESEYGGSSTVPPGWMHELIYGHLGTHGPWDSHTAIPDGKPLDNRLADDLKQMGGHGRYFVIVSAFDFQDWLHHKATLLWRAHISTMIWGHYFDQVLPIMVTTAAPMLGRESTRPLVVSAPFVPDGHVIVGAPYLKTDSVQSAAPATNPKP